MQVMLTLFHHSAPKWLNDPHSEYGDFGGWPSANATEQFVNFAEVVIDGLGAEVDYWTIFNEPHVYTILTHCAGVWPPGKDFSMFNALHCFSPFGDYAKALSNMATAHKAVYDSLHQRFPNAKVRLASSACFKGGGRLPPWWVTMSEPCAHGLRGLGHSLRGVHTQCAHSVHAHDPNRKLARATGGGGAPRGVRDGARRDGHPRRSVQPLHVHVLVRGPDPHALRLHRPQLLRPGALASAPSPRVGDTARRAPCSVYDPKPLSEQHLHTRHQPTPSFALARPRLTLAWSLCVGRSSSTATA
jgi:hypothetical protein